MRVTGPAPVFTCQLMLSCRINVVDDDGPSRRREPDGDVHLQAAADRQIPASRTELGANRVGRIVPPDDVPSPAELGSVRIRVWTSGSREHWCDSVPASVPT